MIKQYCTFHLGDTFMGVEVSRVQEVLRYQTMTQVPLASSVVEGLINLRGRIVTAIDLRRRIQLPPRPKEQLPMNVVVRDEDSIVSLLVDEIGDVLEVEDTEIRPPPSTLSGVAFGLISGVYKLESQLLLLLDIEQMFKIDAEANAVTSAEGVE